MGKETKTERRSNRIFVDVVREGELNTRTCAIVPAAAPVIRADGRAYGGSVCLGALQGVHDIRE